MGPTRPYKRKPRGLPGALHLGWLCVVAFSEENRESTFPENAPVRGRIFCGKPEVHFSGKCSCAWSHFLRKTGSPLFRKMLLCVVAFSAENRESTFPENAPAIRSRGR